MMHSLPMYKNEESIYNSSAVENMEFDKRKRRRTELLSLNFLSVNYSTMLNIM